MKSNTEIKIIINHRLVEKDMTKVELCKQLNLSYSSMMRRLNGETSWNDDDKKFLKKFLKLDDKEFINTFF